MICYDMLLLVCVVHVYLQCTLKYYLNCYYYIIAKNFIYAIMCIVFITTYYF